ncbi:hypothetical protein RhiJN_25654 [Ceratobasidium sp. AG-Ba]|nr:hypothetical protein RhiJN_25654 [Ceratobasidium sp. AG-Ba]
MSTDMSPASPSHSSWLRTTSTGLRANKSSRSVLATIGEEQLAPAARATSVSACFKAGTFGRRRAAMLHNDAPVPAPAPKEEVVERVREVKSRKEGRESDVELPSSPTSSRSRSTVQSSHSTIGSSRVHIATAIRVHTARARSHSIDEIRQLLSPESPSRSHSLRRPSPLDLSRAPSDSLPSAVPYQPASASSAGPSSAGPRSINPSTPSTSYSLPPTPTSAPPARRRGAIVKDYAALLEHIHEDETESTESAGSRTSRNATLAHHRSDSATVSLPPPPRPRNRALVRPVPHPFANPSVSNPSRLADHTPRAQPLLRPPSAFTPRLSPSCLPSPAAIPLPLSSTLGQFPPSPESSFPSTPRTSNPPSPCYRSSFLPSCKSTIDSATLKDQRQSASSFGDFQLPKRASSLSFASSFSGFSARSPTEAESIPIGFYNRPTQLDFDLAPLSPRSSLSVPPVDVELPSRDSEDESSESGSCLTTDESFKHSKTFPGRPRSLSAAFNVSSLQKVDRVLGKGAARALLSGVTATTTMSEQPSAPLPPSSPLAGESFLPTLPVTSPFGRKSSGKKGGAGEPNMGRPRSDDVHGSGLVAHMNRFMGRTPSPSARMKELEDEVEELPPPPPPPKLHGRKHSSSDPSAGIIRPRPLSSDRPVTTNVRSAAERAEMVKKARKIQQLMGAVPSENSREGTFYKNPKVAKSEELVDDDGTNPVSAPLRVGGRRHSISDVLAIEGDGESGVGRVPSQNKGQARRGFHRPTASVSSALSSMPLLPPMGPISPALISPASMSLLSPGYSATTSSVLSPDSPKIEIEAGSDADEKINVLEVEDADEDDAVDGEDDDSAAARRAKRAKVAKLNRYLGSRVPAHLVLGLDEQWDYEQGLPEARQEDKQGAAGGIVGGMGVLALGGLKKRRESEGAGADEEIGDLSVMSNEEKARAVRRKAKMEKMFGERPPQKLYQPHADRDTSIALDDLSEEDDQEAWEEPEGGEHYKSYRASFNSLAYFVTSPDRDSLEGLYTIVSSTTPSENGGNDEGGANQFAARRKRAAKLSKFFGVSYRDLFGAVLDILESDVREDKEEGSLSAAETKDLLKKLKRLKAKGEGIHV